MAGVLPAQAAVSECLAIAEGPARVQPVAYQPAAIAENQVQVTYIGHSTFIIESHQGIKVATDYAGYSGNIVPDAVTMNRAHRSHYTDAPDPAIKHVLRGWNPDGGPVHHDVMVGDIRIRNVTTDIRGGMVGRMPDGNSIFVFEVGGLCIGHLGHLHHELTSGHVGLIGRLDVVMVPVDGGYTMAQVNMMQVLKDLKARIVIPMHFFGPTTLARFLTNARSDFEVQHVASPTIMLSQDMLPEKPTVMVLGGY
jgi:L-ascorbate metabolism protein UlaG (beta-lactamase superfamily)